MTYRPPPVRPSTPTPRLLPRSRKRLAQACVFGIAALTLAAASASADPGRVAAKQAQAQQVLDQIAQIDRDLGAAVETYNLANVKLRKIESDLRENRKQLKLARANLKVAQDSLSARLVAAYTSRDENSTLAVLLGSTSFEELLNRMEAIDSTSQQDASIVRQVTSFKAAVKRNEAELRTAHESQQHIVAQKAAQKQHIESQLASRRQMLSSIRTEIQHIRAEEAAQQRQLAAAAQTRLAGLDTSAVGVSAATSEGTTIAPPGTYGGVVGIAMRYLGVAVRLGRLEPVRFRLLRPRRLCLRADGVRCRTTAVRSGTPAFPSRDSSRRATSSSSTG